MNTLERKSPAVAGLFGAQDGGDYIVTMHERDPHVCGAKWAQAQTFVLIRRYAIRAA